MFSATHGSVAENNTQRSTALKMADIKEPSQSLEQLKLDPDDSEQWDAESEASEDAESDSSEDPDSEHDAGMSLLN